MRVVFHPYQAFLVALVLLVMAASSLSANEPEAVSVAYTPETLVVDGALPELSADAFAVFDVKSGKILATENSQAVLPIASVTKLLTAATVLRTEDLTNEYVVKEVDLEAHGRAGRLSSGEHYSIHEILFPLLLESSNDAAAVIERETKGDILRRMNAYAKELGATSLSVSDASGLSDRNTASVQDLVTITRSLYVEVPQVFDISRLKQRVGPYVAWSNNSPILATEYRGGKHGFTEAAQRTLVALFEEEFTAGNRVIGYVLLGSEDLRADTAALRAFVEKSVTLK